MNEKDEAVAREFADIISYFVVDKANERGLSISLAIRALEISLAETRAMELFNEILGLPPSDEQAPE